MFISLSTISATADIVPVMEQKEREYYNTHEEFRSWFNMNESWIQYYVNRWIQVYGWALGGAPSFNMDLFELYRNCPYNLEEKYGRYDNKLPNLKVA